MFINVIIYAHAVQRGLLSSTANVLAVIACSHFYIREKKCQNCLFYLKNSKLTLHLKQSLCHLASSAITALSEIGFEHPLHLAAKIVS